MNESVNYNTWTCALTMSEGKACSPSEDLSAQSDLILSCSHISMTVYFRYPDSTTKLIIPNI